MSQTPITLECEGCGKRPRVSAADKDGNGTIESPTEICWFCEAEFCAGQCYRAHDCPGHDAESVACMGCSFEIKIDPQNTPATMDGDPYCAKCVYEKTWVRPRAVGE